jgi:anti-sigma B factor antagonist
VTLSLSTRRDGDTITVAATGAVDLSTASVLQHEIAAAITGGDAANVALDLSEVAFLDSAGINTLLISRRLADSHGRGFRVVNVVGLTRDLLEMTGVWSHLGGDDA